MNTGIIWVKIGLKTRSITVETDTTKNSSSRSMGSQYTDQQEGQKLVTFELEDHKWRALK